ncbi:MAG: hypothetical protein K6G03_09120 [Lachnospiraceae bacterium]|nr:hypothetical protein [Lachnospiraceae bacterium]
MSKISYRNPLTKIYQYEYAMLSVLNGYFKSTSSKSLCMETLRLYYAELVKTNDNGNPSYVKQLDMEDECEKMLKKAFSNRINMGDFSKLEAIIHVYQAKNGSHAFIYDCGQGRKFAIRISCNKPRKIKIKDLSARSNGIGRKVSIS